MLPAARPAACACAASAARRSIGSEDFMAARLIEKYQKTVVPVLTKEFGNHNVMAVPKLDKITVTIGMGEATQNAKLMDGAVNEFTQIAGHKPVITKATKSIAQFK